MLHEELEKIPQTAPASATEEKRRIDERDNHSFDVID